MQPPALAHAGLRCFSLARPRSEASRFVGEADGFGVGSEREGVIQCLDCPSQHGGPWQGHGPTCQTDICTWRMLQRDPSLHGESEILRLVI